MWYPRRFIIYAVILVVAVWLSMRVTNFELTNLMNLSNAVEFVINNFTPEAHHWANLPVYLQDSVVTLGMAFLGTFLALVFVLPLSFFAARNTSPARWQFAFSRSGFTFLRAVPEIVFGMVFVVALGLGPFAAVLAILLHNIGVLGKLISELIEAAEDGPQEAMKATGATRRIAQLFAIIPQIWPNVLSHYFYRFEVAIRTSLVLGIIGGGGIGQRLYNDFNSYNYEGVAVAIVVIMVLVLAVDFLGSFVRKRVI
ncbi:phosphonate transport system permease protein [Salsuginibacillus halophilus]|uniref:Phosphonate transport system permease protein n=1 Tax=Salsuginibacillus halophilus TaxID=517424 RepID=A0A2P8HYM1_9BACI|nr:phosphonate ABC transporter, permease protein PhnE [Salsuginibacillus halophilus]PSL51320.1 phosphonate transport system permease protein [Salsuginibacillus halophilus]